MTWRSALIGLFGAALVCGVTFFNDRILDQTHMIGNNMPVSVYGLLLLYLMLCAPLLRGRGLRGSEIAVVLVIILAAACVPGSSFLRTFTSSLVQPHHYHRTEPGWKQQDVLGMVPERMLADVSRNENEVVDGFRQSLRTGVDSIAPGDVPWYAFAKPFGFWLPIVLALWLALLGLSLVIHRQWSRREHLPYPVITFTTSLFPEEGGRTSSVFRERAFWIGAGFVFVLHMSNYLAGMFPHYVIPIERKFNLTALKTLLPFLSHGIGVRLLAPTLYFTVIGLAFMIPKEVSLSLGIGPFFWAVLSGLLFSYGINMDSATAGLSSYMAPSPRQAMLLGANLGLFAVLLYAGRRRFSQVFRGAILGRASPEVERHELWGSRLFLAMIAALVLQLWMAGIDLHLAVPYVVVLIALYVVMSRLIAEAGLFYIQPFVHPCVALWGLFGVNAIGLKTLLVMQLVTTILFVDPRESLMPFLTNNWKLLETRCVKALPVAGASILALVLGITIALPVTLYLQYDHGHDANDSWADGRVPKFALNNACAEKQRLLARDELEGTVVSTGWARFTRIRPDPVFLWALLIGLVVTGLVAAARLRFPWWPLHPLLLVTWATEPLIRLSASFLLGWVLKAVSDRYGGPSLVKKLKPLMIGLIAGEILAAIVPSLIAAVCYALTGEPLAPFVVLPR